MGETTSNTDDDGGRASRWLNYVLILFFGFTLIVLVTEGIRRAQWEAPARGVLFEAVGTAEWFRDNDKGDVRIKLREHRTVFIYPAYATGWGTLTAALHPGARVKLLHEPPLWPHKEFRDGLATYEIEVNGATVIPYKFAARNWTIGVRIEIILIVGMATLFVVFIVKCVRTFMGRS